MVFCNCVTNDGAVFKNIVTILILIDGFLQFSYKTDKTVKKTSHNPYFNRWFSAIQLTMVNMPLKKSHNPYFNRWFSAM